MESMGFEQYMQFDSSFGSMGTSSIQSVLLFIQKDGKEFSIIGGKISVKEVEDK